MHTTSSQTLSRRTVGLAGSLASAALLAGCSSGMNIPMTRVVTPAVQTPVKLRGNVHGGQQPVSGATIQLYAVGTSGNGSASLPLLSPAATTDGNGNFNITGQYECPQQGSLTYIVATEGNPGLQAGTNNAAISLMAAIGPCNTANPDTNGDGGFYYTLDPNLSIFMDEVTTVAAAYALAPFALSYSAIGSSSPTAIATAFSNATMLADIGAGTSPGPGLPATVSYSATTGFPVVINTVADVLAGCVNSDGTGSACFQLYNNFFTVGIYPSDTFSAALAVATNPGVSVASFYNIMSPTPPFAPFLTVAPNDWTVAVKYTGLNLSSPASIAFDGLSNLWIANATGTYVSEVYSGADGINATGVSAQYSGGGLLGPQGLAIDLSNNIWIANTAGSSVVELDDNGNVLSGGSGFTGGGINAPVSIALDSNGNAWVANFNGNSITQLLSNGAASSFSPITQGLVSGSTLPISLPTFVAVDSNNDVWVSNSGLNTSYGLTTGMLRYDQNGNPQSCSTQNLAEPLGIAFDPSGTAWIASNGVSAVQPLTSACASNGSPLTGGGLSSPVALAVDGNGNIWAANTNGSISELTASTGVAASPATGYGTLNAPDGIAIDASGSVWTANSGDNSVTEFIGLAAPPAATPLVANAAKVGRPVAAKRPR